MQSDTLPMSKPYVKKKQKKQESLFYEHKNGLELIENNLISFSTWNTFGEFTLNLHEMFPQSPPV